ncbi:RNA polymerase sigma factor [Zunongwangia sp. HGR-M22]|uniref:RNA polymerase sigma factor n=1 Tax=Zunongwangia sp. HGR-M22 TaxID=3015168 RepID=UPI0022DD7307|nr:RNA polymerase sigma-70 factor [Zunongwangia sp. HGR-M22]WBL26716.1 RNA polymerase sigma-70 factor [Zunongwangia sp. HGR-M22]
MKSFGIKEEQMSYDAEDDKFLIFQLKKGNEKAFNRLYDKYLLDVYHFSLSLLKSKDHAMEVVQDVFMKIWITRDAIDETKSFKSFILTITKNLSLNILNKAATDLNFRNKIYENLETQRSTTNEYILSKEYEELKNKAIASLPSGRKKIFLLSREEGKSYQEISEELDISINTVKTQIKKALQSIREYFSKNTDIDLIFLLFFIFF